MSKKHEPKPKPDVTAPSGPPINPFPPEPQQPATERPAPTGDEGKPKETLREKLDDVLDDVGNAIGEAKFGE